MDGTFWFLCFYCCFFWIYHERIIHEYIFFLYDFVPGSHLILFAWLRHCRSNKVDKRWLRSYNLSAVVSDSDDKKKKIHGYLIDTGYMFPNPSPSLTLWQRAILLWADMSARCYLKINLFLSLSGCCDLIPARDTFLNTLTKDFSWEWLCLPQPKGSLIPRILRMVCANNHCCPRACSHDLKKKCPWETTYLKISLNLLTG